MVESGEHTHAVILSSGGAYRAFEVGVMKAIFTGECASTNYRPLDADVFTGTSVGLINAVLMASHPGRPSAETARDLERFWLDERRVSVGMASAAIPGFLPRCTPI